MNSLVARRDVYIDFTVDRVTDVFLFGAIGATFATKYPLIAGLSLATMVISLLSSYGRAQAEALRLPSRSPYNRGERLGLVFIGLFVTAVLHLVGRATDAVLLWSLIGTCAITVATFCHRFLSAVKSPPYTEMSVETWDDQSFLPRLMNALGSQEGFAIIEQTKDNVPVNAEFVYVDRYKDRTRVRIYKHAS
jgi:hypothetical protein